VCLCECNADFLVVDVRSWFESSVVKVIDQRLREQKKRERDKKDERVCAKKSVEEEEEAL
jgi:hypothetical protein